MINSLRRRLDNDDDDDDDDDDDNAVIKQLTINDRSQSESENGRQ